MILALCGTSEGRQLLAGLSNKLIPVVATVTTPYGVKCLEGITNIEVLETKLDEGALHELIDTKKIKYILDVSHPYAENISKLAMKVSEEKGIQYLRYERQNTEIPQGDHVIIAEDYHHAAQLAKNYPNKVFLTTGSNHIPLFVKEIGAERLIARVLPTSSVIKRCEDYGLTPHNLIGMKGPFTGEMNQVMFGIEDVSVIITKDSGEAGGTEEKISAAQIVGKPIIIIKRPQITYGNVYHDLNFLISDLVKE
ncbi:precorrin-6A reductase [Alkaliphilus transvaalensis]|uniref:precorrin-6A reductase n=1 Tax=Alkaliphilus transvaalensis TaxID=114628 RepID=UPI00047BEE8A|nr:precorrin-6A reductase [Alkaliphilus transvaalensis]